MSNLAMQKTNNQKMQTFSLWFVTFLCIFIPLRNPLADFSTNAIKAIPDVIICGLFAWFVFSQKFRLTIRFHDWMFAGFIAVGFISNMFINNVGLMVFILQVRSIIIYYLLYFVIRNLNFGEKEFTQIVRTLQYVSVMLFAFGTVEKITNKDYLFSGKVADSIIYPDNFTRVYSLFYNPNTYGVFLVFVLFMSIFLHLHHKKKTSFFLYVVLFGSLLLSISRSSLIIMGIALIAIGIWMLFQNRNKIAWKTVIVKGVAMIGSIAILYSAILALNQGYYSIISSSPDYQNDKIDSSMKTDIGDRFNDLGSDSILEQSANNGRIFSVRVGLQVFSDHKLFGSGFGTYGSAASMNKEPAIYKKYNINYPFYSDNEYIKVLAESGIFGTLFFVLFLIGILVYYRKDFSKILFCVIFGWFGLFYNVFEVQIAAMLFWVILSFENIDYLQLFHKKSKEKEVIHVNS